MGVEQCDHQRVFEIPLTQPESRARASHDVGGLGHVLHAAGDRQVRLAEPNHLRRRHDRLDSRTADPVDGERGRLYRDAGLERDVAGPVDRVARRLERVAHHDVIDNLRLDACPLHRGAGGEAAQLEGRGVLEGAYEFGHGRARTLQNQDIFGHGTPREHSERSFDEGSRCYHALDGLYRPEYREETGGAPFAWSLAG